MKNQETPSSRRASPEVRFVAQATEVQSDAAVAELYPHAVQAANLIALARAAVAEQHEQQPTAEYIAPAQPEVVPVEPFDEALLHGAGAKVISMADYPLERARHAVAVATGQAVPEEGLGDVSQAA
jgi:hypothetical protein